MTSNNAMLDDFYQKAHGQKLELIERIRHGIKSEDLKTPGIVVIGFQSSGKSTLLSRLAGMRFPVASNLCTRTPIIVQAVNDASMSEDEFRTEISTDATFPKDSTTVCTSESQLSDNLSSWQNSVESEGPVLNYPIYVRRTRASGPELTLIDLPGIAHKSVKKGFDIYTETTNIVEEYAKNENMILLVVLSASDDFGTSKALGVAETYDPEGKRTLGVVTKCDMPSTDIIEKINMTRPSDHKLKMGFVAICNQPTIKYFSSGDGSSSNGQVDYSNEAAVTLAEEKFFSEDQYFRALRPEQRGIRALTKKIVRLQGDAVQNFFSSLPAKLREKENKLKETLAKFPKLPRTDAKKREQLEDILWAVQERIGERVRGDDTSGDSSLLISSKSLEFCEKFHISIYDKIPNSLSEASLQNLRDLDIKSSGFILKDETRDNLIVQSTRSILFGSTSRHEPNGDLSILSTATKTFLNDIMELMVKAYTTIIQEQAESTKFPKLAPIINMEVQDVMKTQLKRAVQVTDALLSAENSQQTFTQNSSYNQAQREVNYVINYLCTMEKENQKQFLATLNNDTVPKLYGTDSEVRNAPTDDSNDSNEFLNPTPIFNQIFKQKNISPSELANFFERYLKAKSSNDKTSELMRLQICIHCYLHVILQRLTDVIPMVVRNMFILEYGSFFRTLRKELSKNLEKLEPAWEESVEKKEERELLERQIATIQILTTDVYKLSSDKSF